MSKLVPPLDQEILNKIRRINIVDSYSKDFDDQGLYTNRHPNKATFQNFKDSISSILDSLDVTAAITEEEHRQRYALLNYLNRSLEDEVFGYDESFLPDLIDKLSDIQLCIEKLYPSGTGKFTELENFTLTFKELIKFYRQKRPNEKSGIFFEYDDFNCPSNEFTKWICNAFDEIYPDQDIPRSRIKRVYYKECAKKV